MAVSIGSALLKRLVAQKAKVSTEEVERVLSAYDEVALGLLETGAKVRTLGGLGYFVVIDTKPTRRINPQAPEGELVEVPSKTKIVFKKYRKK